MMYLLYQREYTGGEEVYSNEVDRVNIRDVDKEYWNTVYLKGEQIGYRRKGMSPDDGGLEIKEVSYLRMPVGGVLQEILVNTTVTTGSTLAVESFDFSMSSGKYTTRVSGRIKEDELYVTINRAGESEEIELPVRGKIYAPSLIPHILVRDSFSQKKYSIPTYDPMSLSKTFYRVVVLGKSKGERFGKEGNVWRIKKIYSGLSSTSWISEDGTVLMEKAPEGYSMYDATKEEALNFSMNEEGTKDLLTEFSIDCKKIEDPRSTSFLKMKFFQLKSELMDLNDFNQKFDDSLSILTVSTERIGSEPPPDSAATQPTTFLQSDDQRVIKKANSITKGITDTLEMLKEINKYLYENISKNYASSIPSAVKILNKMQGDCNEHSTLFAALARALDIPARINVGLVYKNSAFYYHAWNQAYVNGKWHTFDPTYGQYPADATHIKFLSGGLREQIQLIRLQSISCNLVEIKHKEEK